MTYKNLASALVLLTGFGFVACGGSTTINFVGEPDGSGGEGGEGTGGNDGDGGSDGEGGMGGDASGGTGTGGGSGGIIVLGYCGDGSIADDEECDDGNERSGDGCSSACVEEASFDCTGEPSVCSTCGNGTLDAGEGCDDGNVQDGDGCSADCRVEGDCEEPILLEWDGQFTQTTTITSSTAGGGGSNPAQVCSGLILGEGSDRTFKIVVEHAGDLTITVAPDPEFDPILRIYGSEDGSVCDPDREAFCFDEVGAGGTETFHFTGMPAGAEVVISVDGADEGEAGDFTLTASQECPLDFLKLHRLSPYWIKPDSSYPTYGQVSLKNTSDYCAIDLSRVNLYLTDTSSAGETVLPERALAPLDVFRASIDVDPAVNPNAFDLEGITLNYFDALEMGAFICNGACDLTAGTNVLDGVTMGGALTPPDITFPTLPDGLGSPYSAFVRVAYDGGAPDFSGADWSPAFLVDPDDFPVDGFGYYGDGTNLPGPISIEQDAVEGAYVSMPPPAVAASYPMYGAEVPAAVNLPTYVSYKVRTTGYAFSCYTGVGINNGSVGTSGGFGDTYDMVLGYNFPAEDPGWSLSGAPLVTTETTVWHLVEFENANWTDHTVTVRYDGEVLATGAAMSDTTIAAVNFFGVMPYNLIGCQYSDIIVRNGPPGRIWESPPVLIAPD